MGHLTNMSTAEAGGAGGRSPASLDREIALSRVGGDMDLLKEIGQLFLDDAARMLAAIESAVKAKDAKAIDRSAHTLKGCVSNFGAIRLYEAAFALEKMGRNNDLARVDMEFRILERELRLLEADLRELGSEN